MAKFEKLGIMGEVKKGLLETYERILRYQRTTKVL